MSNITKEWQDGWDNCFCSFCNELLLFKSDDNSWIIKGVMDDAALTTAEIKHILQYQPLIDNVKEVLKEYLIALEK